jgi:hypothetical protein
MASNELVAVQTYQPSMLTAMTVQNPFIDKSNKRFINFQNEVAQRGSTVKIKKPSRFTVTNSLTITSQPYKEKYDTLTVSDPYSVSVDFTALEYIYTIDESGFMRDFGMGASAELGAYIGGLIADQIPTSTYRFFGDGVTPINSYTQYAQALANFREIVGITTETEVYVDSTTVPQVIATGANQFTPARNDEGVASWEMGNFRNANFYETSILPDHTAGSAGQDELELTVVSISGDGTQLTLSGFGNNDSDAIKEGDKLTVAFAAGMRALSWVGHRTTKQPVQVVATGDAESNGSGQATVDIYPALISTSTNSDRNINIAVAAGQKVTVLGNHRCGLITVNKPIFLAMPKMPEKVPYPTSSQYDENSGASLRMYYGTAFGQDYEGFVLDGLTGSTIVSDYTMMIAYPPSA